MRAYREGSILRPGRNCDGIYPQSGGGILVDAASYYGAFHAAASLARRSIMISGWQFDSEVQLVRGREAAGRGDTRLLPFLRGLCRANPELEVYILAWDFSVVFALEREWFQELVFNWSSMPRLRFRFDATHAVGGCHHQKFVVIDDCAAFVGGVDLCSNRWDDRRHLSDNPLRLDPEGEEYDPHHDLQAWVTGPVTARLAALFRRRWSDAGGGEIPAAPAGELRFSPRHLLPLDGAVAVSRTAGRNMGNLAESVVEIENLFCDAIAASRRLIYIENQYVTSEAFHRALTERMRARHLPPLQIVFILPSKPHALREEIFLGLRQIKLLRDLRATASACGHRIGIYYTVGAGGSGNLPVYIHSKLLIVDDRFLTVGSANMTNRSLGLDTEINLSWEATDAHGLLASQIADIRTNLMLEHVGLCGLKRWTERRRLRRRPGLVDHLDTIAASGCCRLRLHDLEIAPEWKGKLAEIVPGTTAADPGMPLLEETMYELLYMAGNDTFVSGIAALDSWFSRKNSDHSASVIVAAPAREPEARRYAWMRIFLLVMAALLSLAAIILLLWHWK